MSARREVVPLISPSGSRGAPDFLSALWSVVADSDGLTDAAARVVELVQGRTGADAVGLSTREADGAVVRLAVRGISTGTDQSAGLQDPVTQPLAEGGVLAIDETRGDATWPEWSATVGRRGVRSARFVGLGPLDGNPATLELYASRPHAFDEETARLVAEIARSVGSALRQAARVADLEQQAHDRELVGRATGILMERYHLSAEQSMGYLVRSSERAQLALRDLAWELVAAQDRAAARTRAPYGEEVSPRS